MDFKVICSQKVSINFGKNVLNFKDDKELIERIIDIQKNKIKSNNFSRRSLNFSKKIVLEKSWIRIF